MRTNGQTVAKNTRRRNPRIYINYSLCAYYRFLSVIIGFYMVKVKEMMQEGLIHNFWISSGGIIKIRESAGLAPFSVSYENDLILEY